MINIYSDKKTLASEFTDFFIEMSHRYIPFYVALSGGSTPKLFFKELAQKVNEVKWENVHFFWGDERCVAPTDNDSNYKMTLDNLGENIIKKASIYRIKGEDNPEVEKINYAKIIKNTLPTFNNLPQFDLIILGMGDDGHTASIFPHEIEFLQSENICELATHPLTKQKRITLTGKIINNAKNVAFLVSGVNKAPKLEEIFNNKPTALQYPAYFIKPIGRLVWFTDKNAASKITD